MGFAVHAPARFVRMQHRRLQGFPLNLFVPGKQNPLQSIPHLHQTARRDLQLQVKVEDFHDLRQRVAQRIVQPGRKHQDAIAQRRFRQGVGHFRLDAFLALRAPIAVDRVLGHFRLNLRDVFDIARPRVAGPFQSSAAVGTARQLVRFPPIDAVRHTSPAAGMAVFRPRLLLPRLRRRFFVDGNHARGRAGRRLQPPRLGQSLAQLQQGKDDRIASLLEDRFRLLFGQRGALKNLQR